MTKADIARAVQERASLTMKEATDAVELVIATLKETLAEGETVKVLWFWYVPGQKACGAEGEKPQDWRRGTCEG